jgi:predicted phosphodiesterase
MSSSAAKLEPILFVPDTHRPYHDEKAWQLMLKVGRDLKPKHIVCIGDLADFYSVSSHSKDPRRANSLDVELKDVHKGLDELDSLKAKNKLFIAGNHCDRLSRYLQDRAPELFDVIGIPQLLKLEERGWKYTPYKDHASLGKLHMTHDVGVAGRNAVFRALDTYQHSIVTGHTHRLAYIVEGNAVGEFKVSATFGWLGDASKVDYMHKVKVAKDWALGFGIGYYAPATGYVYLTPVPIIKYTCVVNGKLYKG